MDEPNPIKWAEPPAPHVPLDRDTYLRVIAVQAAAVALSGQHSSLAGNDIGWHAASAYKFLTAGPR